MTIAQNSPYLWLCSYPKSGNTWVRIFLHHYQCVLNNTATVVTINDTPGINLASRTLFEQLTGVDSALLTFEQMTKLRQQALTTSHLRPVKQSDAMVKVHDQYRSPAGTPLVPAAVSKGVVYIVRNPIDIVASFAHYRSATHEQTVAFMNDNSAMISDSLTRQTFNLPQFVGSWSSHVTSWLEQTAIPLLVIRYEDMLANPMASFTKIIQFSGLPICETSLAGSVQFTQFDNLKTQEQQHSFQEVPKHRAPMAFFRQGKANQGQREVDGQLQQQIRAAHFAVMQQFGYA